MPWFTVECQDPTDVDEPNQLVLKARDFRDAALCYVKKKSRSEKVRMAEASKPNYRPIDSIWILWVTNKSIGGIYTRKGFEVFVKAPRAIEYRVTEEP